MKNIFSIFLLLSISLFSYGQWNWVNPIPTGNDLSFVQMVNEDIGYAAGSYNTILKTTNGGVSWTNLDNSMVGGICGLFFTDALTGYILSRNFSANKSFLYKTINGGVSWTFTLFDQCQLEAIAFADSSTGFMGGNNGLIYKTSDGGITWSDNSLPCDDKVMSFFFLNPQTGFATTGYNSLSVSGQLFKTTDGGETWFSTSYTALAKPVYFIDENVGFAMGINSYTLMKTIDGGSSWDECIEGPFYARSLTFFNSNDGVLGLKSGDLLKTSDGGETWTFQDNTGPSRNFMGFSFMNESEGITIANSGYMARTNDGGLTWEDNCTIIEHIIDLEFVNDSAVYACTPQRLYRTNDYGTTWESVYSQQSGIMQHIAFPSENTGYASINDVDHYTSLLVKTMDGGVSWQTVLPETEEIGDIFFFDELNGFVSSGNVMLNTVDGGISWDSIVLIEDPQLYEIEFLNRDTGFVTLTDYRYRWVKIFRTMDGGITWVEILNDFVYPLTIEPINEQKIVVCSNSGLLYYSYDLGDTWTSSESLIEAGATFIGGFSFKNDSVGYCFGNNNDIFETKNGGSTWTKILVVSPFLKSIAFNESRQTGLIGCSEGCILRLSDGGNVSANSMAPQKQTIRISPNPATSELEFSVPDSFNGNYTYSIFDTYGRCVYEKTKKQRETEKLNISHFKPGMYFLRIVSGNSMASGKFIVE